MVECRDTKNAVNRTVVGYRRCIYYVIINSILIKYDLISLLYLILAIVMLLCLVHRKCQLEEMQEVYKTPTPVVLAVTGLIFIIQLLLLLNINL